MGKKILVIEDNVDNRLIYRTMLEYAGCSVLDAADGEAGIQIARAEIPDLILMDISIPKIDGWQATQILKGDSRTAAIPIIALTAHAMEADRTRAVEVGCDGYLAKPVEPRRVVEEIERLIGPCGSGVASQPEPV